MCYSGIKIRVTFTKNALIEIENFYSFFLNIFSSRK